MNISVLKIDCSNLYYIFFPFWADPMTINMSHCFFESRGNSADSGDGSLDTTINQIGFSILTWHVLMNLHFPFLPNASIILVWSWPKFRHSKSQKWKVSRCIAQPTSDYNQTASPTWKIFKYRQCPTLIYTNSIKQALGCFVRLSSSLPL